MSIYIKVNPEYKFNNISSLLFSSNKLEPGNLLIIFLYVFRLLFSIGYKIYSFIDDELHKLSKYIIYNYTIFFDELQ